MIEILEKIQEKKNLAESLLSNLQAFSDLDGVDKLVRKIKQEIILFNKVKNKFEKVNK